jgi:hypothetical protein|tara:strand:- start:429 stop:1046 length:618 start_codon:yes stop_codon:yes gene_type:complete
MIIGLCGFAGSGKGTLADILVENHNFRKISFATKLKDVASVMFGWDRDLLEGITDESRAWREEIDEYWSNELEQEVTPRIVLQIFGTDCVRNNLHNNIWVSIVKKTLIDNPDVNWVIPDIRFPNEVDVIQQQLNGSVWWIKRGELPDWYRTAAVDNEIGSNDMLTTYSEVHESEYRWINTQFDNIIENDSSIEELGYIVALLMHR